MKNDYIYKEKIEDLFDKYDYTGGGCYLGYKEMSIDEQNDVVVIFGNMDVFISTGISKMYLTLKEFNELEENEDYEKHPFYNSDVIEPLLALNEKIYVYEKFLSLSKETQEHILKLYNNFLQEMNGKLIDVHSLSINKNKKIPVKNILDYLSNSVLDTEEDDVDSILYVAHMEGDIKDTIMSVAKTEERAIQNCICKYNKTYQRNFKDEEDFKTENIEVSILVEEMIDGMN